MYKVEGLSRKANEFWSQNSKLPIALGEEGPVIRIIEVDGWLRICIEVSEDTTNEQIRNIAPIALDWRGRLLEYQGGWMGGGKNEFLEKLYRMQTNGKSYKILANMINEKIVEHLRDYIIYREDVDKEFPDTKSKFNEDLYYYVFWVGTSGNPFALSHARDLLRVFGFTDNEIENFIRSGVENIKNKEQPFEIDSPINRQKMIQVLRTWRNGKIHKAIQKTLKEKKSSI